MGWIQRLAIGILVLESPAFAQSFYLNSQGSRVELTPAPDRIAVRLAPGAAARLSGRPELDLSGPVVVHSSGLTELPLSPGYRGMGREVARRLVASGISERAGAVFAVPGTGRSFSLDRELIVKLRAPGSLRSTLDDLALVAVSELGHDGTTFVCRAADADSALKSSVAASTKREVAWALPDFMVPLELYHRPSDPFYPNQWHHQQASGAHISSEAAWEVTLGDPQVVVAVIDTGVDLNHPDFDPTRLATGYNAQTGGSDPTPLANTIDAHGTCCSGEIAATADNNQGGAGVCPRCSLMPIKMMDGATTEAQLSVGYRAFQYATDNGAWVLSNSWGIDEQIIGQVDIQPYYQAIRDAVANGRGGQGALVLFASGNGDYFGRAQPIGPNELQNLPEVMAVGGTNANDRIVGYSDYGPNLSVVAPTSPADLSLPAIFTTDTLGDRGFSRSGYFWTQGLFGDQQTNLVEPDQTGNHTAYFTGTSASCPIAAGVVALTWSANPQLTPPQVRQVVEQTADKVGGIVYDGSGHDDRYGYGRVNAARAVRAAVIGFGNPDGSVCSEDFNCEGGSCAKVSPDDEAGICAEACSSDAECGTGRKCAALPAGPKVCLPACTTHGECAEGAVCVAGACMLVACSDGTQCPAGSACPLAGENRRCTPVCKSDKECAAPELCLPAGSGFLCGEISCSTDGDCPEGTECGPIGFCQRPGGQADPGCGCAASTGSGWGGVFLLGLVWAACRLRRRAAA